MSIISKEQIETPALLLDLDVFENNVKIMADFMKSKQTKLRPHYKTFKCPAIVHKLINSGAKGITCAKLSEAETLVASGIRDILIANQEASRTKMIHNKLGIQINNYFYFFKCNSNLTSSECAY